MKPLSRVLAELRQKLVTPFVGAIEKAAFEAKDFRRVLWTGQQLQLATMVIPVGGEVGEETHANVEQAILCMYGLGKVVFGQVTHEIQDGDLVIVPAGTRHNILNIGQSELRLVTFYGPPNHLPGRVHPTKDDADQDADDEAASP